MLLEWRTKQALEYKSKAKTFWNEEIFQDNQMVYLLAPHASTLQTITIQYYNITIPQNLNKTL